MIGDMKNIDITAVIAFASFCLSIYNCILEIIRRRPRAMVRVYKRTGDDSIDKGANAAIVNVGELPFTVTEIYLLKRDGSPAPPTTDIIRDQIPKVVHPGEMCKVEIHSINSKENPVFRDIVRIAFSISTGKHFYSKKLPKGIESGFILPVLTPRAKVTQRLRFTMSAMKHP